MALVIILVLLIALAGAAFGATSSWTSAGSSTITRTFPVGVPARLMVNTGNGTIHIHTGSATTVVVQVTKQGGGFGGADPQITMNQTDSTTVRIETRSPPGFFLGFRSIDIDVTMPSASSLQLQNGSGGIQIEGINGQVNAETGSGSITVADLSGQITLNTGSGELTATSITGQANLRTGSGSLTVSQAHLKGTSLLHTGSGSITFDGSLDPNGTYCFETGSGAVNLTVPASSALSLDLHTGSGSITNSFGSNETGGAPRAKVFVQTGSGSITINKS